MIDRELKPSNLLFEREKNPINFSAGYHANIGRYLAESWHEILW